MVDLWGSAPPAGAGLEWPVPWQPVWGESNGLASRASAFAARAAVAGATRLPEGALALLLSSLSGAAARFDRGHTRAAHEFLGQALGELPRAELARRTRRSYLQLLRVAVDSERFLRLVPRERIAQHVEVEASPEARAVFARRKGCLMVSPHLGNWEVPMLVLPTLGVHPLYGVAKPPKNLYLSRAVQASRERNGSRILSRKGAMAAAPAILKAGGTIAMVIDQRTSGRAMLVPFFGRLARCERAPGVLLKRQRVPIVLSHCLEGPKPLTYRIFFTDVLEPDEWGRREVEEIALRINQGLERLIRAHPEQYVWIHDRYRDTPRELAPGAEARILRNPSPQSDP